MTDSGRAPPSPQPGAAAPADQQPSWVAEGPALQQWCEPLRVRTGCCSVPGEIHPIGGTSLRHLNNYVCTRVSQLS